MYWITLLRMGNMVEQQYLNLLSRIKEEGLYKEDRTGTGCYSIWGASLEHDMAEGFPMLTTKKMWFKGIVTEMLWMLSGSKNVAFMEEHGAGHIWNPWADDDGNLGKIYGPSWRNWDDSGLDQLKEVINQIKTNPNSRRHLVLAWNPGAVWSGDARLPPCHFAFQFQVQGDKLNCNWMMRSNDAAIGLPWNLAFYALLQCMVAQVCGLNPGRLTYWGNDVHIYANHLEGVDEHLSRANSIGEFPKLVLNPDITDMDDFTFNDIKLEGYSSLPAIKLPLAV